MSAMRKKISRFCLVSGRTLTTQVERDSQCRKIMLKFTNHLANTNLVLVRKQVGDKRCTTFVLMPVPRRGFASDTECPKTCKAKPTPPKSRKWLWSTLGAVALTGAAVVYANKTPEVRLWLDRNVPIASEFVAVVSQENESYGEFLGRQIGYVGSIAGQLIFGKEGGDPTILDMKAPWEQDIDEECRLENLPKEYTLPSPTFKPLYVEERDTGKLEVDEPEVTVVQTEKCTPKKPPKVVITKDMVELEQDMHDNIKVAIDNYKLATEACAKYNKALFNLIETPIQDQDKRLFNVMMGSQSSMNAAAATAKEAGEKARKAIDALDRLIDAGVQAPPESIAACKRYITKFRDDLKLAQNGFKQCMDQAILSKKYATKVADTRNAYKDELKMLFPCLDLNAPKLELKGDVDLFLMYTLRQIEFLQSEIAELATVGQEKLNRAIECNDEKGIIDAKVEEMIRMERLEKEMEYQKKALEIQMQANRKMREEIQKQYTYQNDVMQAKIKAKEAEIMARFAREVSEQLENDRLQFKKELAEMAGKMKAIEYTLKQRAKGEQEARRSQCLWAAAEALLAATRSCDTNKSLHNEIKALEKAGKNDKLVASVINGIPKETREKGIATEVALKDKFDRMEKTARKVALVKDDGAGLPIYFLSWLQSKLLFSKLDRIPQEELNNQPTDFTKLDTFDIMNRAKYHMDGGDLASAMRYVNLLRGAPRAAAQDWLDAARSHLEVRQAAEALMSHASVCAMMYS